LAGVVVGDVVDARELVDLVARDLPRALHDPRKRAIKTRGLVFDLLEHVLREIEALLSLVGTKVADTRLVF
jgi:hypothetical protein